MPLRYSRPSLLAPLRLPAPLPIHVARRHVSDQRREARATDVQSHGIAGVREALGKHTTPRPSIFFEFSMRGQVGVVAGGAGALGLESALALAEAGAIVYVIDIFAKDDLREDFVLAQQFVADIGEQLHYISGSATNKSFVDTTIRDISDKEGRFDFCVAANGYLPGETPALDVSEEVFDQTIKNNLNATFFLAQAAGNEMKRWGQGGSILLYSSIAGDAVQRCAPNQIHFWAPYAIAKGGVHQMTRSLAVELAKDNIKVNSLSPGQLRTPMTKQFIGDNPALLKHWSENNNPTGRLGKSEEVRGPTLFFCSKASNYVTGTDLRLDGGMRVW